VIRTESQSLTITAPVSDTVSIKSITGYRSMFLDSTNDLSGIGGLYSPFTPNTPLLPIVNATQSNQKSFQEELQANIDTTWVYSTVGYLYWWGHTNEGNFPNTYNAPFGSGLGITAPYLNFVAPTAATVDDSLTTISDALYTQDQVHLTHQLDLVGGARWTKDQRSGLDGASTPPASAVFPIEYHKSTWTYMGGLNYKINEDIFAYLKYSTAYISGGEVANINFQPTTARSWETGLKADLLEHKLRVNLALFTVGYGQFQILTGPRAGCPPSLFPSVSLAAPFCIINGGDAKDGGAELELTYVPVTGLTLEGSVAHNNMHFTRVNPGLSVEGTFVAPQSPVWTASLSAAYRGSDLGALYGSHVVGMVQAQYTSSQFPQAADPLPLLESVEIPAKTIINGRAGLGGFKFGPTEIEVVGYVKNLTNNRSEAFGADLAADFAVTFERARTYGIDVTASF
jgi:iron complex outermembrane receptor protein